MRRRRLHLGLGIWLALSLGPGCQLPKPHKPYPPDPLFERKQPVERPARRAGAPPPFAAAVAAPRPPHFPETLLVSPFAVPAAPCPDDRRREDFAADRGADAPDHPSLQPPRVCHDESDVEESSAPPVAWDHAPDYRWLVGKLDKQLDGRFILRFDDVGGPHAGRVMLDPASALAGFADGEVVRVEGVLVPRLGPPPADPWDDLPQYRMLAVGRAR